MKYTKYIYDDKTRDFIITEMTKEECRKYLTNYYYDNEMLDDMINVPNQIPVMCGYVEIKQLLT